VVFYDKTMCAIPWGMFVLFSFFCSISYSYRRHVAWIYVIFNLLPSNRNYTWSWMFDAEHKKSPGDHDVFPPGSCG
jgi:hypothetical protein